MSASDEFEGMKDPFRNCKSSDRSPLYVPSSPCVLFSMFAGTMTVSCSNPGPGASSTERPDGKDITMVLSTSSLFSSEMDLKSFGSVKFSSTKC